MRRRQNQVAATSMALISLCLAWQAQAEAITLQCTYIGGDQALRGSESVVDFDVDAGTVRYPSTNVVYRVDQVTERYVHFGKGVDVRFPTTSPWRLDKRTGVIESINNMGAFTAQTKCQRVENTDILKPKR